MSDPILFQMQQNDVCEIILNRPDKINTLNKELIIRFTEHLKQLASQKDIRIVIISGAGKWFCGGADLKWMQQASQTDDQINYDEAYQLANLFQQLNSLPVITIAKVTGGALGGGIGILCCCDVVIASEESVFSFGELKLGLLPATIMPYVLSTIGERQARRYMLSGEQFSCSKAKKLNIIHDAVAIQSLEHAIDHQVQHLLSSAPNTLRECKSLIQQYSFTEKQLIEDTARILARSRSSKEAQEGITAFLKKSKPWWVKSS
ncbi:Methylglutaconyl-CoA hydratase [hydrothermal vent metagenome]|uniref:Methylglutaconyl-CoA hydratase n=1 Tax=hydrothermal vent metagenome TaxID=652676 RepID=A0A3B1AES7_9ZZZZ